MTSRAVLIGALSLMLAGLFVAAGTWAPHAPMDRPTGAGTTAVSHPPCAPSGPAQASRRPC